MADWATISSLATAGGTLVLAVATFASVRSANRAARTAERALLVGLRPLLVTSRREDPELKVGFADRRWLRVPGGTGSAETSDEAVLVAISLRNAGSGLAVMHGWRLYPERIFGGDPRLELERFQRLTRDIYVAPGDLGFWQGAMRDPAAPEFGPARAAIDDRTPITVDVLYGDEEGGQRRVTRFGLVPRDDGLWMASVARHWNVDAADPR